MNHVKQNGEVEKIDMMVIFEKLKKKCGDEGTNENIGQVEEFKDDYTINGR